MLEINSAYRYIRSQVKIMSVEERGLYFQASKNSQFSGLISTILTFNDKYVETGTFFLYLIRSKFRTSLDPDLENVNPQKLYLL